MLQHDALVYGVVLRTKNKIIELPAGGEGQCDPTVAEVVNDGPLLGDSDRMVERGHATAGADTEALRDSCERGTGDGRIGVRTAERVEMAFRSPHSFKAVAIEILRALDHQAILIPARRVIVAPHKEAEAQRPV